jgi:hypothetical protein
MGQRSSARRTGTGIVNVRMVVAAALAAAVCMLVLPAAASASVDEQFARPYRIGVNGVLTREHQQERTYNAYVADLGETAENIKLLLESEPRDQYLIDQERHHAQDMVDEYTTLYADICERNEAAADFFAWKARGWFKDNPSRIKFRRAMRDISSGIGKIGDAWKNESNAFGFLSVNPPDVKMAQEENALAIAAVTWANPKIKSGLTKIKSLR